MAATTLWLMTGVLLDIDGVLVVSWEPLPGAVQAVASIRAAGMPIRLLTNTTSRTRAQIGDQLRRAGFDVADEEILTSAAATAAHLRTHRPDATCLLINSGDLREDLPGVHLAEPQTPPEAVDVVVLGGAGPQFSYAALNRALSCLLAGADLVAMHRNLLWRTASGMQLDTGAFLVGLERASGVSATIIGKPAPAMFEAGLRGVGAPACDALMVGDDIETDVRAAMGLGIRGVQVRTGKFRPEQLGEGPAPDEILDSVADLPALLGVG